MGTNIGGAVTYSGTTATFTPSVPLAYSTTYTAKITTGVKDVAGNLMTTDYIWTFTTGAMVDTTPPTVSATSPVNGATGVLVSSVITATFSEAMNAGSITPSTFLVSDGSTNIGGAVTYSGTTATFTPSVPLAYSTTYTAKITTGVKDVAGNLMTTDYIWIFTTGAMVDTTPPTVSATSPVNGATGILVNSVITATFSEAMNAGSITPSTFLVSNGSANIGGAVTYTGTTATFTPSVPLAYSTTYTATITTGVMDVAGNAMTANHIWNFTTTPDGGMSGQQAYYKFDEGVGAIATDSSGNNRNGTIVGATWTTGKIGGGLNFDGNDYVTIPRMNYDEVSVSAWFNKNTSGTNIIFGGFRYNANVQLQEGLDLYFQSGTPNRLRFAVVTRNVSGTITVKEAIKDFADSNGIWYHVVGTYNKVTGEQKLYVDGQLVNTQVHPSGNVVVPLTERNYMAIGTRYTDWGFFRGSIDDVRVFNRALSAQEALSLFNDTISPDMTPPTVLATSPVNGATGVLVNSVITATFSEAMNAGSITPPTFLVSDGEHEYRWCGNL
ncbi:MAG: Ig-like domain-containing protein [Planctomycetia bacterium]|nr:Ig-like domain-containing protein [Planctomycetia bacterium]